MRFISTRIHGIIDYAVGVLLILVPYLLGFANGGPEQWVPMILGVATIGASLFTRYEYGAVKVIPMRVHLGIDLLTGALLLVSPWLFGFADRVYLPHVIVGLAEIGVALMTQPVPRAGPVEHRV